MPLTGSVKHISPTGEGKWGENRAAICSAEIHLISTFPTTESDLSETRNVTLVQQLMIIFSITQKNCEKMPITMSLGQK